MGAETETGCAWARQEGRIQVAVFWVVLGEVQQLEMSLPVGASVADALKLAACLATERAMADFPDLSASSSLGLAVFGKRVHLKQILHPNDRIELCEPLIADPMDARRHRAKREHRGGKM